MPRTDRARSAPATRRRASTPPRLAFVGDVAWLDSCAPPACPELTAGHFPTGAAHDADRALAAAHDFRPDATFVFDPLAIPAAALAGLRGLSVGVLVDDLANEVPRGYLREFDRLVSFNAAITGRRCGGHSVWRAIPPPVSDAFFAPVRPLHDAPRALSFGRSTPYREAMLAAAKHHHDLLHVIHGVSGEALAELLREYDVGVHIAAAKAARSGPQVGIHLAAGQLLITDVLAQNHGLERNIDYLQISGGGDLVTLLDRLARFPEMHQRIRVRGRMKAEQFRSSRVFARIAHDLRFDVAAFGAFDSGE